MYKVAIIGGGAAGMMAAVSAASRGKEVVLLEKNEKLGKKMYITGKGRCNVTSNKSISEIIKNIPGNGKFMYKPLNKFSNIDLMNFIEKGVKLKVERGDRVFPDSDKSSDIIKCFQSYVKDEKVNVVLNCTVKNIKRNSDKFEIETDRDKFISDSVIIATGGSSYASTGSTGDGYRFAKAFGHSVTDIKPSLIPLITKEKWVSQLTGFTLKNVSIEFKHKNKTIYKNFGEMEFLKDGIGGAIVLSGSRYAEDYFPDDVQVIIDLKPALDFEKLDKRILRDFDEFKNKEFKNSLNELLPSKLIPIVLELSNIDINKKVNEITKEERKRLVNILKKFTLTATGTRPIDEAIVTRGGVNVKEINPETMESKIVKGLYFAGEVIDVDGLTGGFNLQIAFSTGYCAGIYC